MKQKLINILIVVCILVFCILLICSFPAFERDQHAKKIYDEYKIVDDAIADMILMVYQDDRGEIRDKYVEAKAKGLSLRDYFIKCAKNPKFSDADLDIPSYNLKIDALTLKQQKCGIAYMACDSAKYSTVDYLIKYIENHPYPDDGTRLLKQSIDVIEKMNDFLFARMNVRFYFSEEGDLMMYKDSM